jgi:hypothetical protein
MYYYDDFSKLVYVAIYALFVRKTLICGILSA